MSQKELSYKNTYVIDMDRVIENRIMWTILGDGLPVIRKNDKPDNSVKQLTERFVKKMIKQYEQLSQIIGKTQASTVIEYLDKSGKPLITLYPTNDVDMHNSDWSNLAEPAMADLTKTYSERFALLNLARNKSRTK